jgi:hypothetical protein
MLVQKEGRREGREFIRIDGRKEVCKIGRMERG